MGLLFVYLIFIVTLLSILNDTKFIVILFKLVTSKYSCEYIPKAQVAQLVERNFEGV